MAKEKFHVGEKVAHKIDGSPVMYVVKSKKPGKVTCQWFTTTGQFQEVSFDPDALTKQQDGDSHGKEIPTVIEPERSPPKPFGS